MPLQALSETSVQIATALLFCARRPGTDSPVLLAQATPVLASLAGVEQAGLGAAALQMAVRRRAIALQHSMALQALVGAIVKNATWAPCVLGPRLTFVESGRQCCRPC